MHLFLADGREPLQKLVYGRSLVEMLEERGNREPRASEAPLPGKLSWCAVDRTAKGPIHILSLSLINSVLVHDSHQRAKSGNKGFDAAMAAIEMANLMQQLRQLRQAE